MMESSDLLDRDDPLGFWCLNMLERGVILLATHSHRKRRGGEGAVGRSGNSGSQPDQINQFLPLLP
jgi:hypothetical protein